MFSVRTRFWGGLISAAVCWESGKKAEPDSSQMHTRPEQEVMDPIVTQKILTEYKVGSDGTVEWTQGRC